MRNPKVLGLVGLLLLGGGLACTHSDSPAATPAVDPTITGFAASTPSLDKGGSVTLLATFSQGVGMVSPGNLPITSGVPLTVTPAETTVYTLTVTSSTGAKREATTKVTVLAPVIIPAITAPKTAFVGQDGVQASVTEQADCTYAWRVANGVLTSPANAPKVTFKAPVAGELLLDCRVTHVSGKVFDLSARVQVDYVPLALNSFKADRVLVSAGEEVSLIGDFKGGAGVITPGNLVAESGVPVKVTPGVPTTYVLTVTDPKGQTVQGKVTVDVADVPRMPAIFAPEAALPKVPVAARATLQAGCRLEWTLKGADVLGSATGEVVTFTPHGDEPVQLSCVAINAAGRRSQPATATVRIASPTILGFKASSTQVTPGQPVQLTATFEFGRGRINPGNLAVESGVPVTVKPDRTTTYTLDVEGRTASVTVNVGLQKGVVAFTNGALGIVDPATLTCSGPFLAGALGNANNNLLDAAVSPDGTVAILSHFTDRQLHFVDLADPAKPSLLGSLRLSFSPEDVEFTPDGRFAVVTDGGTNAEVAVVDVATRTRISGISGSYQAVTVSPDGRLVLAADWGAGSVDVFRLDGTGTLTLAGKVSLNGPGGAHLMPINLAFSPDGKTVVAVGEGATCALLKVDAMGMVTLSGIVGGGGTGEAVAIDAARGLAFVRTYLPTSEVLVLKLEGPGQATPTGQRFAVPSATPWFGVDTMAVDSPRGVLYLTSGNTLTLIDITSGKVLRTLTLGGEAGGIAFPARLTAPVPVPGKD